MAKQDGSALTAGQRQALGAIDSFWASEEECFILKGYAGTGKTFLLKVLAERLQAAGRPFCVLAPTGRAAKVAKSRLGEDVDAGTIHRKIYKQERVEEYASRRKGDSEDFKVVFSLRNNEDAANMVYLVDEASMVSEQYLENEYLHFGSGNLLEDFLRYVDSDSNNRRQVVFIGDEAQLPPVGASFSPALSATRLRELGTGAGVQERLLTEVVRQRRESAILSNATKLRDEMTQEGWQGLKLDLQGEGIEELEEAQVVPLYLAERAKEGSEQVIIVAYTNEMVGQYNKRIRQALFGAGGEVRQGDRILVVRNQSIQGRLLLNGDFGEVVEADNKVLRRQVSLKQKGQVNVVDLAFRNVTLRFWTEQGQEFLVNAMVFDDLLTSGERELTTDQKQALYVDFKMRNSLLKKGTPEFSQAFAQDPYMNALQIKYGYAITCHKAQGGEWKRVIVDFAAPCRKDSLDYARWAYTAITRSRECLGVLHVPQTGPKLKKERWQENAKLVSPLPPLAVNVEKRATFPEVLEQAVRIKLNREGIQLTTVQHSNYLVRFLLQRGAEEGWFLIYYSAKEKVTKMHGDRPSRLLLEAELLCDDLRNRLLTGQGDAPEALDFPENKPFLKEFYVKLQEAAREEGLTISGVARSDYLEKYRFFRGNDYCEAQLYYKNTGVFSTVSIESYSDEALGEAVWRVLQKLL